MLRESMAGGSAGAITAGITRITSDTRAYARRHFPVGARQLAAAHPAPASDPVALGRRSVCVRTCDGYFFPVAALNHNSEISSHQASCDTLCPEAETKLFVMPAGSENIDEAAAARGGELYSQLMARIKASDAKPASCGCHSAAGNPIDSSAVLNDPTLRPGDTVVTAKGVRVFKGGAYPFKSSDFMSLAETRDLPIEKRGALAAIDRVLQTPRGRFTLAGDHHREQHGPSSPATLRPRTGLRADQLIDAKGGRTTAPCYRRPCARD